MNLISKRTRFWGAKTGSQRRQVQSDVERRLATISPGNWHFRRHPATSRYGWVAPKRGVTGSNPVAPTPGQRVCRAGRRRAKRRAKGQAGSPVADASVRRRGHGEDAIASRRTRNRYISAVSMGFSPDGKRLRRNSPAIPSRRSGTSCGRCTRSSTSGLQASAGYTVRAAVEDWLEHGLSDRSVQLYRDGVRPLTDRLGTRPMSKLSAADVRLALGS
jgi:hypothetical protein